MRPDPHPVDPLQPVDQHRGEVARPVFDGAMPDRRLERERVAEAHDGRLVALAERLERPGDPDGARSILEEVLDELPQTTAVLAANDRLALGAIDAIRDSGRSCPDEVSVVGFNDMPYSDRFSPPLTTIRISQYELGAMAARLLLETIADPGRPAETRLASPVLVIRGSTAPVPT